MEHIAFKPTKLTLLSLLFASMMVLMGSAIVAPALPRISTAFPEESEFVISLIITLPSLAVAITGMGMGALADRFGKVKVLAISLLIFGLAGVSGYFLNDMVTILIGRFFVGVGLAGLNCSCTALLSEYYTGAARVRVLSYQAAANGVGVLILEVSGGVLAGMNWRLPFLIYGMGFVIMMLILISAKEPTYSEPLRVSENAPEKKINMRLLALCYVSLLLTMCLMYALPTKLTYFIMAMGGSTTLSGLFLGFNGLGSAIASLCYKRLSERYSVITMMTMAFGLVSVGYLLFALPASYSQTLISVCLVGMSVGFMIPTVTNTLARESTQKTSGKIMGGFTVALYLGQFTSSLISIPLITAAGSYGGMFAYLGVASVLVFITFGAAMMHERLKSTQSTTNGGKTLMG